MTGDSLDPRDFDFDPIKKWVEEASTTSGDVKLDPLKKWLDKCEAKFKGLSSELEGAEEKVKEIEAEKEELEDKLLEYDTLKEMLADIPRGIITGRELMDSVDTTGWQQWDGGFLDPAKTGKLMVASGRRF